MDAGTSLTSSLKAKIGSASNSWAFNSKNGFDLTHSDSKTLDSGPRLSIKTTETPIIISPKTSALVIIDMQNYFLSPSFGRETTSAGHRACKNLIDHAIPAARKAGIQVVWVNWGLTEQELEDMPPAIKRCFGFMAIAADTQFNGTGFGEQEESISVDRFGEARPRGGQVAMKNGAQGAFSRGMGNECGMVKLEDGTTIDAGRLLMRDTWNAALYLPLDTIFEEGRQLKNKPDVWIHKNRMSGMWGAKTELEEFLEKEKIQTLFFAGVNTDQCVGGTLTDAFSKGYDCILLSNGSGTTSPEYAQQCFEFNSARTFGFCTSCQDLSEAVHNMTA